MDIRSVIQQTIQRAGGPGYARKRGTAELADGAADPFAGESLVRVLNRMEELGMHEERAHLAAAVIDERPLGGFNTRERLIGKSQLMSSYFLYLGVERTHAVGRIVNEGDIGIATGFLISPRLLMTNNHVLPNAGTAARYRVQFDYILREDGTIGTTQTFRLLPNVFFVTSSVDANPNLDYAIVAVETVNAQGAELAQRGYIPLVAASGKLLKGEMTNIIQHPGGEPQQVALRDSQVTDPLDDFLRYEADTQPGSSGSPVFNDQWQLGALHHSGIPEEVRPGVYRLTDGGEWDTNVPISAEQELQLSSRVKWIANEGVRISSIVKDVRAQLQNDPARLVLFEEAVRERVTPPAPNETRANVDANAGGAPMGPATAVAPVLPGPTTATTPGGGAVTWTIPLSVTVQVGPEIRITHVGSETPASQPLASPGALNPLSSSGQGQVLAQPAQPTAVSDTAVSDTTLSRARELLANRSEVLEVRGGYLWQNGEMTDREALVVVVDPNSPGATGLGGADAIRSSLTGGGLAGVPVDVTLGGASALLRASQRQSQPATESLRVADLFQERVPQIGYTPPPDVSLEEVNAAMEVTCHVSPDDGWPVLREFLDRVNKTLTIGMYDLTAPHVVDRLKQIAAKPDTKINLAIQRGAAGVGSKEKKDDIVEEVTIEDLRQIMGGRFRQAYVDVSGQDRTFASAYHIKVAVRDGQEMWLSSGNMQSSNQPNIQPAADNEQSIDPLRRFNREWHVVIRNRKLARIFEKFLLHDLKVAEENPAEPPEAGPEALVPEPRIEADVELLERANARYFKRAVFPSRSAAPVRVQPLLTPDNYLDFVVPLVQSAQTRLYIQNQSMSLLDPRDANEDRFLQLLEAIKGRQNAGVDVRIIFRVMPIDEDQARATKERLVKFGLNKDSIRVQEGCHNKGVVVDSKVVLLGSHNWSNQGVIANRDASLIFWHPEMARYYEQIFLFDWDGLTRQPRVGRPSTGGGRNEALELAPLELLNSADRVRVRISDLLDG